MSATAIALWLAGATAQAAASAPEPAAGTVETFEYTVQAGETCAAIAKRFFGDAKRYDIIHQYNPGMGPTPHDLKAGRILILPKVATAKNSGPDAEVTASRRRVEARAADENAWRLASIGLDLFRGWRVNTLARASAELTFRDTSVLELRENTLVIIFGSTQSSARRTTTEATLDRGALRSRLGELSGGASLKVDTPSADAELEGGRALVTVDDAGTSRLANHGKGKASVAGKPTAVAGAKPKKKKPKPVKVAGGMGSKVETGKSPTPPKPLPPSPAWAAGQRTRFVSIPAAGASVEAAWIAEPKAASYRIEVARKPDGRDVIADVVAPGTVTSALLHGLPPGEYWMSVASIDADAFEGIPGELLALRVVEGALVLPGGAAITLPAPAADADATAVPLQVPRGTILRAPAGSTCRLGDATSSAEVVLTDAGATAVTCTESSGGAIAMLGVEVLPWTITLPDGASERVSLVVGEPRDVEFSLASASFSLATLRISAPAGITVGEPVSAGEGRWRVRVTATQAVPAGDLILRTPTGEGADAEVQRIGFDVVPGTAPIATVRRDRLRWIERWTPERNMWEIGVYGGVMVPSRNLELFEADPTLPAQGFQPLRRVAPDFGARVGYFPLRVLGVEVEGGAMPTRTASDDRATLFTARAHVIGRLGFSSITPFLLLGAGMIGVDGSRAALGRDVDAAMHFGGGLEIFAHRNIAVRFDVRDVVTAKRGIRSGVTSSLEALLGLSITLGRKRTEARLPSSTPVASTPTPAAPTPTPTTTPTPTPAPLPDVAPPPADAAPTDRDGDGVMDADDTCVDAPETSNGFEDADGCPDELPKALADFAGVIDGIEFATNSDVITPASKPTLDHAIGVLKEFPGVRVMIAGHTDDVGKAAANVDLSRRRALAVRTYLVDAGIDAARLETRGAGPDEPIASNKTKAGRAKNRRIEFELLRK